MANIALVAVGVYSEEVDLLDEPVKIGTTIYSKRWQFQCHIRGHKEEIQDRDIILHLDHELEGELQSSSWRNHAVPVLVQVTSVGIPDGCFIWLFVLQRTQGLHYPLWSPIACSVLWQMHYLSQIILKLFSSTCSLKIRSSVAKNRGFLWHSAMVDSSA